MRHTVSQWLTQPSTLYTKLLPPMLLPHAFRTDRTDFMIQMNTIWFSLKHILFVYIYLSIKLRFSFYYKRSCRAKSFRPSMFNRLNNQNYLSNLSMTQMQTRLNEHKSWKIAGKILFSAGANITLVFGIPLVRMSVESIRIAIGRTLWVFASHRMDHHCAGLKRRSVVNSFVVCPAIVPSSALSVASLLKHT